MQFYGYLKKIIREVIHLDADYNFYGGKPSQNISTKLMVLTKEDIAFSVDTGYQGQHRLSGTPAWMRGFLFSQNRILFVRCISVSRC
jgi:hypothetical protein